MNLIAVVTLQSMFIFPICRCTCGSCDISLLVGARVRWPTCATARANSSRQKQIHHGKSKFITARANSSRQKQIHHGKSKFITARANSSRQKQIHHGKSKFITARANYSRQEQIIHGKTKIKSLVSGLVSGCVIYPSITSCYVNIIVCR